ncbi:MULTISPECIES: envelope stress response membrane protein PspB [Alishewanella]|jgi:phage shock protein B|uniref:Phage shock protein B n=2 Tax=Alishewanella TaxID=111142 RepID=H3ZHM5_9ALTE|nr:MULTISPECIES: envelope stress response membrane protein PspB [Alishewanella]EHR39884.1 phage shock protein B [Alishewanella jeotgali KCTC 22429]EJI85965.1 phage shock protein B [Alishewanella aestuarii B11]MCT8126737.1 envelope stress response membrane protein PspB [Alishewanella sp. BS5-314]OCW97715.1 phage shock protein B [Alishewanella sp. HH-ZS]
MDIHEIIFVPLILFMIFVAPLWVIMHYRSKNKIKQGLSDAELNQLNELTVRAEKMAERIKTLEAILDADSPRWRNQHGQ